MFSPAVAMPNLQAGPFSPPTAIPIGLSQGCALQRLATPGLLGQASCSTLLNRQLAQGQQLLQMMGILLTLMQSRLVAEEAQAGSSDSIASTGSVSGSGSSAGVKAGSGRDASGTVTRQGKPIGAQIAGQFDAMIAAAKKDGVKITIVSGKRTRAEQERLYAAYKNGTGNLAAKPGTSNHESGEALDLGPPSAYSWLKQNAGRFGFKNKIPSEPWHWSLSGT